MHIQCNYTHVPETVTGSSVADEERKMLGQYLYQYIIHVLEGTSTGRYDTEEGTTEVESTRTHKAYIHVHHSQLNTLSADNKKIKILPASNTA